MLTTAAVITGTQYGKDNYNTDSSNYIFLKILGKK